MPEHEEPSEGLAEELAQATARGVAASEGRAAEIRELLAARVAKLDARARACLDELFARMSERAPRERAEIEGIARACELEAAELLALDGGVLEALVGGEHERSLGLYVDGPRGPVLAAAWHLPPAEAEQLELREVAGAWTLGLPGSLGLAGISATGYALVANVLRGATLGPGVPGSALLRRVLSEARLEGARRAIERTALVDGRCWMLADGRAFYGFEQIGERRILTRVGPKTGHVHANHCFDPSLRQLEALPRSPASFRRLELASTLYVQRRPDTAEGLLEFFDAVEEAAFARPEQRAETLWAVELSSGRALLRRRRRVTVHEHRFHTPFVASEPP